MIRPGGERRLAHGRPDGALAGARPRARGRRPGTADAREPRGSGQGPDDRAGALAPAVAPGREHRPAHGPARRLKPPTPRRRRGGEQPRWADLGCLVGSGEGVVPAPLPPPTGRAERPKKGPPGAGWSRTTTPDRMAGWRRIRGVFARPPAGAAAAPGLVMG